MRTRTAKILKLAKGYRGRAKNCYRIAVEKVEKGLQYAYRDRKQLKRDMRGLWIQRINAGAREFDLSYSRFMNGLKLANIDVNRKVLAELALKEPLTFEALAAKSKDALRNQKTLGKMNEEVMEKLMKTNLGQ
mmetsp:Transcript_45506/g.117627  ORF Transcript_45506/g.117627 Transcript_45506/m.117627 type:complete len:133 (-) Transcript_45506:370-768(-)